MKEAKAMTNSTENTNTNPEVTAMNTNTNPEVTAMHNTNDVKFYTDAEMEAAMKDPRLVTPGMLAQAKREAEEAKEAADQFERDVEARRIAREQARREKHSNPWNPWNPWSL